MKEDDPREPWVHRNSRIIAIVIALASLAVALSSFLFNVLVRVQPQLIDSVFPQWASALAAFLGRFFWLLISPIIIWMLYKARRLLFTIYRDFLLLVLRPVLPQAQALTPPPPSPNPTPSAPRFPFAIKLGTFEFSLADGVEYRQGEFEFDAAFSEIPQVFISECTGGNWLLVKIDGKTEKGFKWAVQRATGQVGRYPVRLQWFAIAPVRTLIAPDAQLIIQSAHYGVGDLFSISTNAIQAQVEHDVFYERCGNHLDGDPVVGTGKQLLISYTYKGRPYNAVFPELSQIRLPTALDNIQAPRNP
jgi:hypothetical protein